MAKTLQTFRLRADILAALRDEARRTGFTMTDILEETLMSYMRLASDRLARDRIASLSESINSTPRAQGRTTSDAAWQTLPPPAPHPRTGEPIVAVSRRKAAAAKPATRRQ